MRCARGFTLVEIMVAVGVFALISVTIYSRISELARHSQQLEERTFGTWVASNQLAALALEFRIARTPPELARRTDRVRLAGHTWQVTLDLQATSDPGLHRVETIVRTHPAEAGGLIREGVVVARMTGFVGHH